MKALKLILFIFFVCFVEVVSAQISITKNTDMSFGNIAVSNSGGTVILDPDGSRVRTGGVSLPGIAGTITAASFTVSGGANLTYAIILPSDCTISSGGNNMTIDTFTSSPPGTGTLSGATPGTQTLNVGATLRISGSQASGTYTCGVPFTITVNYN